MKPMKPMKPVKSNGTNETKIDNSLSKAMEPMKPKLHRFVILVIQNIVLREYLGD